jgi:hypothetical protein
VKRSRRRRALGVKRLRARSIGGGVEDLKRASGKNLLGVERAMRALDIYIGGPDAQRAFIETHRSFFRCVTHYF